MKIDWKVNRITIFTLFLYTAFYSLVNPKPAKRIIDLYAKGLLAEVDEDLKQ